MKILHVNTFESGGAGKAAIRLHNAMLHAGMDSTLLTVVNENKNVEKHFIYAERISPKSFFDKLMLLRPDKLIARYFDNKTWKTYSEIKTAANGQLEYISLNKSKFKIHKIKDFEKYDIIHLHWVADFLDWPSFFKHVKGKKIVWSLHDMAPFTGGYHYSDGYNGYQTDDSNAPFLKDTIYKDIFKEQLKEKKQILNSVSLDLHIIGLSTWMHTCARHSALFEKYKHHFIPNTLDTAVFTTRDKEQCKLEFNLPLNKKSILFISESLSNKRKGYDLFLEMYENLKDRDDICFVSIGKNKSDSISGIVHLGEIKDEHVMARMYNAMDLIVIPSREDNLPNTVVEALCCGVPVLGFNIGGMPDLIYSNEMGGLAADFNSLSALVTEKLTYTFNAEKIRTLALMKFSNKIVVDQYAKVYSSQN